MAGTITRAASADTTTYVLMDGYQSTSDSNNTLIELLGGGVSVVLEKARSESGTLRLLYSDQTEAFAARTMFAKAGLFTLIEVIRPLVNMSFVIPQGGRVYFELDDATRSVFILAVDYRKVA